MQIDRFVSHLYKPHMANVNALKLTKLITKVNNDIVNVLSIFENNINHILKTYKGQINSNINNYNCLIIPQTNTFCKCISSIKCIELT